MNDKPKPIESLLVDQTESISRQNKPELSVGDSVLSVDKETKKQDSGIKQQKEVPKKEINGPKGLEPTRYGDWESKGRCYDF